MEEEQIDTGEEHVEAAAQPDSEVSHEIQEQAEEEKVPLTALQAERRQRQELQENMKMLQDHLALMKANQNPEPKKDEFSGLADDDVLTVGEAKKYMDSVQKDYRMSLEEMKMQQAYPDYAETVRKYLPDVLKENPDLRDDIQHAKNPYKLAYFLAKKSDQYKTDNKEQKKNETAERILKNSNRSGSLSSVGQTAPTNSRKVWSQMTDKEFMEHVNRHMGYG